ncbi:unnamed protein product, partial [Porites lobata]
EPTSVLPSQRGFKLASLNINKLITHIDQLRILLAYNEIDILSINETKLNETISDNEVNISGYDIIRRDRITNGGGGVCFYVKSSINFTIRNDLNMDTLENLCLEIQKPRSKPFVVATWYRPPDSPIEANFRKFNRINFRNDIASHCWDHIYNSTDPNQMWLQWKCSFLSIVNKHAPLRTMRVRTRSSPWITSELKKRMHDRDILKIKASKSNDSNDWSLFKKQPINKWILSQSPRHLQLMILKLVRSLHGLAPNYLSSKFERREVAYNLRDSENKLNIPLPRTNYYKNSFSYSGAILWNSLPCNLREAESLGQFKRLLKEL